MRWHFSLSLSVLGWRGSRKAAAFLSCGGRAGGPAGAAARGRSRVTQLGARVPAGVAPNTLDHPLRPVMAN